MANRRLFGAVMLVAVWVSAGMAQAEGFGGTYALTKEGKLHVLTLELDASGAVQGQMVGPGPLLYLLGEQEGAGISGMASQMRVRASATEIMCRDPRRGNHRTGRRIFPSGECR